MKALERGQRDWPEKGARGVPSRTSCAPCIRALVEVLRTQILGDDLAILRRFGVISRGDAATKLTAQPYSADDAELLLRVTDLRRLDALARAQADLYQLQRENGVLDSEGLRASLESLPHSDDETLLRWVLAATHIELPCRFPTLAQIAGALEEGSATGDEHDGCLVREG